MNNVKKNKVLLILLLLNLNCSFSQNDFEGINLKTKKLINRFIEKENVPGMSVSISYNDTLIFSNGFGYADLENKIKVDPSTTKFRIASITKTLTAATIMKMAEEELIDINKSIYFYLDSLPKKEYDFTIKQVGGHIAGLIRVPSEEKYSCDNTYSKKDFYRVFKKDSLLYKPSVDFSYSNYGYKLLGVLIEKICKKSIILCHKKYILEPLKLNNTIPDNLQKDNQISKFYFFDGNKFILAPCLDCTFKYAQGCYLSTTEDLIRLGNAFLFTNRILNKKSLLELLTPQKIYNEIKTNYGFGFICTKDFNGNFFYGHNGGYVGSYSILCVYPNSKIVIAIMTNTYLNDEINNLVSRISNYYINKIK